MAEIVNISKDVSAARLVNRFEKQLDPQRRILIPIEWRESLGMPTCVYVMREPADACLRIMSVEDMNERVARIRASGRPNAQVTLCLDIIGKNSELVDIDKMGRIRVSDGMLAYAEIKQGIVLQGAFTTATIWAAENCPSNPATDRDELRTAMEAVDF